MFRNTKPSRELTAVEQRLQAVLSDTRGRVIKIERELKVHEDFIQYGQQTCEHDWIGQDDIHPHGTPSETFVCSICLKEESR